MENIFTQAEPLPATVRALRAAGAAHVLAAIRGGAGAGLDWGPKGPHGRVFVTRRRRDWGSLAYTTTVYVDRLPVWQHRGRIPYQAPEEEAWADIGAARAALAAERAARRAAQAAYKADLSAAEAAWLRGEPLVHESGQEGGTLCHRGGRAVSARGLYARIHGGAAPSWGELAAFIAAARRGEEAPGAQWLPSPAPRW